MQAPGRLLSSSRSASFDGLTLAVTERIYFIDLHPVCCTWINAHPFLSLLTAICAKSASSVSVIDGGKDVLSGMGVEI